MQFKEGDIVIVRESYDGVYFSVSDILTVQFQDSLGVYCYHFSGIVTRTAYINPAHLDKAIDITPTSHTRDHNIDDASVSSGGSLRFNSGKPQFSHLSPDFILEMMKVMTKSAEKYEYLNYSKRQDVRTASDSLMRHFLSFQKGADNDEATQSAHLAHIATNAMIMFQNLKDFGDEVDNRYSKEKDKVQND